MTKQWNLNEAIAETQRVREVAESDNPNVLFVQWQPNVPIDTTTYIYVILKRQRIEEQIGSKMKRESIGRLIAGDLGEGGANMLFEVSDFSKSVQLTLEVLDKNGIDDESVIGKREFNPDSSLTYKVIFPSNNERNLKGF
jgi:hypothetical protein